MRTPATYRTGRMDLGCGETIVRIRVTQLNEGNTKQTVILDGTECPDESIILLNDRKDHLAEVTLFTGNSSALSHTLSTG